MYPVGSVPMNWDTGTGGRNLSSCIFV